MILLVGLGNPGKEYEQTRHNAGFMAVDEIVHRYNFSGFKSKFKGEITEGVIEGEKVMVLKPSTYMNLSGESVLSVASFYKIKPEDIIVFHDDMDLPVGKIRVKQGGGSGGHNGLKSIDQHLGNNYHRVRMGVGKPQMKEQVVSWVLSKFEQNDKKTLDDLIIKIADKIPFLLKKDAENFMNKVK
ncbi:MAG: aminoacyl-tRNA hydrolase [Alphaproteobacteria bacterium]|nr:aminoacyl-tRNA hydrolase [Alphaproteobacteria bacterium]